MEGISPHSAEKAAPAQNGSQCSPTPGPGSTVKAAKPGRPFGIARFSHSPTAPAPTGFSCALRRRSHGNVQKPPPPRIPLKGESGSSASSSAPLPPPAPCSLLPLRKALNAGSAYARLSSCNRFQECLTHWVAPRMHLKLIERAQDPWNPCVVKRSCTGAGASLIGNAPDCSHCLNCRCLFSAYAPLPVPEALLPITLLAPGCPYDLPWLRNARTEPDAAGKAQKTFASQNSSPYGFLVPPCPWSEPVRLPDHKEGHKGPHQVPRRSS